MAPKKIVQKTSTSSAAAKKISNNKSSSSDSDYYSSSDDSSIDKKAIASSKNVQKQAPVNKNNSDEYYSSSESTESTKGSKSKSCTKRNDVNKELVDSDSDEIMLKKNKNKNNKQTVQSIKQVQPVQVPQEIKTVQAPQAAQVPQPQQKEGNSLDHSNNSELSDVSDDNFVSVTDKRVKDTDLIDVKKRSRGRPRKESVSSSDDGKKTKQISANKKAAAAASAAAVKKSITATKKAESIVVAKKVELGEKKYTPMSTIDPFIAKKMGETNNIFELVTTQCNAIKIMFDAIREFSFGMYLVCDDHGIHFEDYNSKKKHAVFGNLYANTFDKYTCKGLKNGSPIKIGISISVVFQILRSITNAKNVMAFFIDEEAPSILNIIIRNQQKGTNTHNRIPLADVQESNKDFHKQLQKYTCVFTYPGNFFQQTIKSLNIGEFEYVEFKVYNNVLELSCVSDSVKRGLTSCIDAEIHNEIGEESQSPLRFENTVNPEKVYQGIFLLKDIVSFARCTPLCTSVKIYLENDAPLGIQYQVSGHGEVTALLDPYTLE